MGPFAVSDCLIDCLGTTAVLPRIPNPQRSKAPTSSLFSFFFESMLLKLSVIL